MKLRLLRLFAFALMVGVLGLTACATVSGKPTVVIASPPSGSTYHEGDDVAVQSTSGDAAGIVRVELNVDGSVVRNDTPPSPQTNFSIIQTWKATQGSHAIVVRAYNAAGVSSDPAAISVQVNPAIALNNPSPTATAASSAPSPTPTNTPAPAPAPPGAPSPTSTTGAPPALACTNNAAFVADVTMPDGTVVAAGTAFVKTWRLSNTGTCAWGVGYQFIFVSGEAMTGSTAIAVPATAAGTTVDIIVPMAAPAGAGNHGGTWRMRSAAGAVFGQSVTVKISVPGAPPPAPPAGCTGTPVITSFTASAPSVAEAITILVVSGTTVTLHWGAVNNADSVEIDHSIGGVPAPGTATDTPGASTSYIMTAHCGGNSTSSHVNVNVVAPLPPPVFLYDFGGDWKMNFGTMHINQSGGTASGTYSNGTCSGSITSGTISGAALHAAWASSGIFCSSSGNLDFVGTDSNHFDGNYGTGYKWCGARSGVAFAAGCGFAGHWNLLTNGFSQKADLTQIGNSITGNYGSSGTGSSVDGTVTGWTLNGHWHSGGSSDSFVWTINQNDLTFKGHFLEGPSGNFNWCGWRDGQPAIPNASCHD